MLTDPRQDLRRVKNLAYLGPESLDDLGHVSQVFEDYLYGRADLHTHFGVRSGYAAGKARNYCASLERWPSGRASPFNRRTSNELNVRLQVPKNADGRVEGPVLVIVRELGEHGERIIGGIPSRVVLAFIPDEFDDRRIDAGKPAFDSLIEPRGCRIGRELHEGLGPVVGEWPTRSVSYQLPRNVVENASVVVNDVPKSRRERGGGIGHTSLDDKTAPVDISGDELIQVVFWFDLEGWVGVTVEEPAHLAPCDSAVRVTTRKLVSSALKGISHER